jgi:hypothetical protein
VRVEGWTKRRTRPCMLPGICEQQRQLALHTSSTHIHARRATATGEQQQPWKVTLGDECSGADATHQHSALATRSTRPNFRTLAGQTARAYFCEWELADRYRRATFCTYRGYIWIKPHLQPARELCICTPSISVRGLPAALPALISCCLCPPSLPCARIAPSGPPFRLLTASFLKRWQHSVIPSR